MSALPLAGKVAIVTGGGSGIGRAIALEFASAGADVVVGSRRLVVLESVAEEIRALGRRSLAVAADTTRKTDVDGLVQRTMAEFGGIDILVNNAGISTRTSLLDCSEGEWDRVMDVDLKGYFLCSQAAGRRMVEQERGAIINVSSHAGVSTFGSFSSPYSVAKAGVIMFTTALALELGRHNIRVNCIAPGDVKTEMTGPKWRDAETLKQYEERLKRRSPSARVAEPEEIGTIALFLASEASKYITGQTIIADGGLTN